MSQHFYRINDEGGDPVQVVAGWDRPLGHFFMVVEFDSPDAEDYEPIYSNLNDPEAGLAQLKCFSYFRYKLKEMGINVPESMIEAIEQDKAQGTGNRVVDWTGHIRS